MRKRLGIFYFILGSHGVRELLSQIFIPLLFKEIIDVFSSVDRISAGKEALQILFIIILIDLATFILARASKFAMYKFQAETVRDLRDFSFQKIEQNSHTFFTNTFAGSLVTKARRFTTGYENVFEIFYYSGWKFLVILIGAFVVLTFLSPAVSAIFGAWVVLHILVVSLLLKRKIKYDLSEAEQDSKISGRLADTFSNILAVKFFSARNNEIKAFGEYTKEGEKRSKRAWFLGGKIDLIQHFLFILAQSASLYALIILWQKGQVSTGTIVLVQTYLVIIVNQLWDFANSLSRFMKSIADMKEMTDIFEVIPDVVEPKNPEKIGMREGRVVFQNVSFSYAMGGEVLHNFSLDIKPGERVGIVGHSGAGKSTITKLLLRFNDIKSGLIAIDGQDIRSVRQDDLRSRVSYVPQEPILFHRSIRENISYGKPEATQEEIINVAKQAHAHEFIEKLPYGYDTLVGERGVKLSGGERQRVAIARAMLKDVPVLVLDEATSSLDSVSESYIQDAFNELMKGKTTIVIAHRLSTIQKMDRIIVLDKGEVVEEGTHQELLKKGGLYKELWDHQTGGFLE